MVGRISHEKGRSLLEERLRLRLIAIDSTRCLSASARRALDSDGVLRAINLKGAKSLVVVLR